MSARRLPSGRWQAEVRIPGSARRVTRTFALRRDALHWQADTRAALRQGTWQDPKRGQVLFEDWYARWSAARHVEPETAVNDAGHARRLVLPRWSGYTLAGLSGMRLEVQSWVTGMTRSGLGQPTVVKAYALFNAAMAAAVDEELIAKSPCRKITLPPKPPIREAWWTPSEVDLIVARLDEPYATIACLMVWCGLRWEEAAGLSVASVNWARREIRITQVITGSRRVKPYAKNQTSHRTVAMAGPVAERLEPAWKGAAEARGPGGLIWATRAGRPMSNLTWGRHWRRRIRDGHARGRRAPVALLPVVYHPPHTLRHTGASWMVQAGVPLEKVGQWLGHERGSPATKRYAHLSPADSIATVRDAMAVIGKSYRAG